MKRTLVHPESNERVELRCGDDEVTVVRGEQLEVIDAWSEHSMPPEVLFDQLEGELLADGFELVLPDDLLEQIEEAQEVTLTGRLRAFYADRAYKPLEGKRCKGLGCQVSFVSNYTIGYFDQEFWDREAETMIQLLCLSSKTNDDGYEDEQQWIGVDPREGDGPVYALYTSNAYEVAYPSLDAFLADLE